MPGKGGVSANRSSRTAWSYFIYVLMSSRFEKLLSFSLCGLVAGWGVSR